MYSQTNMAERQEVYRRFGALIKSRRRRENLSQANLGILLGLSRGSIANIECGKQGIQIHQLFLLAEVFQEDPKNLIPEIREPEDAGQSKRDGQKRSGQEYLDRIKKIVPPQRSGIFEQL